MKTLLTLLLAAHAHAATAEVKAPAAGPAAKTIRAQLAQVPAQGNVYALLATMQANAATAAPAQRAAIAAAMQGLGGSPEDYAALERYLASGKQGAQTAEALKPWFEAVQQDAASKKAFQTARQQLGALGVDERKVAAIFENGRPVASEPAPVAVDAAPQAADRFRLPPAAAAKLGELGGMARARIDQATEKLKPAVERAGDVAQKGMGAAAKLGRSIKDAATSPEALRGLADKAATVGPVVVEEGANFLKRQIESKAETIKGGLRIAKALLDSTKGDKKK